MNTLLSINNTLGWKFSAFLFLFHFGCIQQGLAQPNVVTDIETLVDINEDVSIFLDTTRILSFGEIKQQAFKPYVNKETDTESLHWHRFKISNQTKGTYLTMYFWGSDLVDIYIPSPSGYYKRTTGRSAKQQINFHRYEQSSVTIAVASIDFSKPFYTAKYPISFWGKSNLKHPISVFFSEGQIYEEKALYQDGTKSRYISVLSIFFISFILLLVTFFYTRDRNYLNYSLYILALIFMFLGRVPYFYNLLNNIHPKTYFFLTQMMHLAAAGTYLYFVDCFVDFKSKSLKLHKLSRTTLRGIVIFGCIGFMLMVLSPFFEYRFTISYAFELFFTTICIYLFISLLFKKPTVTEKIVLIGSLLLILGNVLTMIFGSNTYFLLTAMAEIIAFSTALTVKNKHNERIRLETKFTLENERNEKQALLELSNLKSSFFTNISHEFRTPLSLIKGPLEDQLARQDLTENELKSLKIAQTNATRMERLVSQLLALAKLESGKLKLNVQPGDIKAFLAAQLASFGRSASEKNNTIKSTIESYEHTAWFDRDALEKIIVNLIGNAIKYTPENSQITVDGISKLDGYHFSVKNSLAEGTVIEIDKLFDRFYQSNTTNIGSGIGLALTKELVELHHGSIDVRLENKNLIVFEISIPISEKDYVQNEKLVSELHTKIGTSEANDAEHITSAKHDDDAAVLLIVDDNEDIRMYLQGIFENQYEIHTAENGKIGFEKAEALIPDIIITDLKMPVEDGYFLTQQCKASELTFHIPIILLTAKDDTKDQLKSVEMGVDAFISKPFSSSFLQATVVNLLQIRRKLQERYSSEIVLKTKEIKVTSAEEQFLNKLQNVLDVNLTNSDFSSQQFSAEMHMSRMQLHRKLKALTGLSTSEFLRSQRLKAAANLIRQNKISISEVGYSVGFNDPSYFAKCFKQEFGVSPTQFEKK